VQSTGFGRAVQSESAPTWDFEALPVGGTGKIQKNKLREVYQGHRLPTA
jgi:hypothetical protein